LVSVAAIAATLILARSGPVHRVKAVGTLDPVPATTATTLVAPTPTLSIPVATTLPSSVGVPVAVSIPDIGVSAPVVPVGLVPGSDGIAVPPISDVGWYDLGPAPGDQGSAALVGHVDGGGRTGVFWRLRDLAPGDRISVQFADGSTRMFSVTGRAEVAKTSLPADLFSRQGPARLALITCGGSFNYSTGHYVDNVVVVAVPA
jgi:hypothetical protein